MKIGIDLYSFDKPGNNFGVGPGVYAWSILPEIIRQSSKDHFFIFANKENVEFIPKADNVTIIIDKLPIRYNFLRILHEQFFIPFYFLFYKLDFVHFLGNNISFVLQKKSIITILDLMWKFYLDLGEKSLRYKYVGFTVPKSIRYSKGVITISKFIADEIIEKKLRNAPIFPILLAPGAISTKEVGEVSDGVVTLAQDKYIYSVTTSMPHKNLIVLLNAYKTLNDNNLFSGKLIVSGQLKGDFKENTLRFIAENHLENKIILTGFVSDADKNYLYKNSLMVVYPSIYEGFGLPVLEAMAFGTPVITSNVASLPEVGGDACLYFNPKSSDELSQKILLLANDQNLREKIIEKGKLQLNKFNWSKTAKETIEAYKQLFEK